MDQLKDDLETERIPSNENKRALEEGPSGAKEGFKKARYSWQIKGKSTQAVKFTGANPLQNGNELDIKHTPESSSVRGESTGLDCENPSFTKCKSETVPVESLKDCNHTYQADSKIDIQKKPSSETQTKFEMLREMGNEYSDRIEEFLKSQTGRIHDGDSDTEDGRDLNKHSSTLQKEQIAPIPSENVGRHIQQQHEENRGRLSFDSPQLNHHLFNISSWLWQKQELGCAIVDNVFNRTLEELGLSPDPEANLHATTRVTVENQSIEAAIHQQGLTVTGSIDEDTNASLSSFTDSEHDNTDNSSHGTVGDVSMTNEEYESNSILSEADENSVKVECQLGMPQCSALKSQDMNEIHVCSSTSVDSSRIPRLINNSVGKSEMDDRPIGNKFPLNGYCDNVKDDYKTFKFDSLSNNVINENKNCRVGMDDKQTGEGLSNGSDSVIDLAVSAAIMSQGLNLG